MGLKRKPWARAANAPDRLRGHAGVKRRARWLSAHPLCAHCEAKGRATAATVVDHIVMLARGGADDGSNMQSLCDPCHAIKSATERGHRIKPRIGIDGYPIDE